MGCAERTIKYRVSRGNRNSYLITPNSYLVNTKQHDKEDSPTQQGGKEYEKGTFDPRSQPESDRPA